MIRIAFSEKYIYQLPAGHRFPIEKYELVKEQLLHRGIIKESQLFDPGLASDEQILRVHDQSYWQKIIEGKLSKQELRKIGLPVTEISVNRARNSVAGTLASARNALVDGLGINLAGGTHHAYADHGEGFCVLNDIAISAVDLLHEELVGQILVVDLDVHQGNGTAKIFENEARVFTFSMHGANNYPLAKEKSDLDIALKIATGDDEYIQILEHHLEELIKGLKPDIIYFQSGVDVLEIDRLGKLALTSQGLKRRDELVVSYAKENNVPLVITMGGGYSARLNDLVDAHCETVSIALHAYD